MSTNHLEDQGISVVIATRDRPELLRRALEAVLVQEHDHPLEVVLVFDRSEPDFDLAMEEPNRKVRILRNDRSPGLAGARNTGISQANNSWIAFCDDDDEWLPGKLSGQFEALSESPESMAACTGVLIRFEGEDTARIPEPAKLTFEGFLEDRMTEVHPSSWLVNREFLLNKIGMVDEEIPGSYAEDYDLFLRTAKVSSIAVVKAPLVRVWWHGSSFFFERWKTVDEALEYLLAKYPEFEEHPSGLARITGQQAVARAAMGHRRDALKTSYKTFRLAPSEKRVPVAMAVTAGVPAGALLKVAHRFGKGI